MERGVRLMVMRMRWAMGGCVLGVGCGVTWI